MKECGIYLIRHLASGKVYVGSSVNVRQRWHAHRSRLRRGSHHSRRLQRAWTKYGEAAFVFEVVLTCAPSELASCEQAEIDRRDAYRYGYNGRPKAEHSGGFRHTEETKRKISMITRGRSLSDEHRAAISAALRGNRNGAGMVISEENRRLLSQRSKGNTYTLGLKLPASFSQKLSARNKGNTYGKANAGVPKSDSHRAACSEGQKRRWARYRDEKAAKS